MALTARRWIVASTLGEELSAADFTLASEVLPALVDGEVLVRGLFHSVTPGTRALLTLSTYSQPVLPGQPVPGGMLGIVEVSRNEAFAIGDLVTGSLGWASHVIAPGTALSNLDPALYGDDIPPETALGVLGVSGLTAYFGLTQIGMIREGDAVLVSSAAGSVGSVVGQLARIHGASAIGIAGSDAKCRTAIESFGYDDCINYREAEDLEASIRASRPDGFSQFFDNVGGRTLDAGVQNLRNFGRAIICGRTASYSEGEAKLGGLTPSRRLTVQGFIVFDYTSEFASARRQMAGWFREGRLRNNFTVINGLEHSIDALIGLFQRDQASGPVIKIS